jgi:signal transduction histidine kinase
VNLADVERQVVQAYPNLQPSRVDLQVEVPDTLVLGNVAALIQCISNLLGNAVKFVRPGLRPFVQIRTQTIGDQTRLSIQDNGIGIETEHLNRIWGVFERAATEDHYEGTGIGLSIVRKAIERMGGTVGVESEPGQGSTFWFQLKNAR